MNFNPFKTEPFNQPPVIGKIREEEIEKKIRTLQADLPANTRLEKTESNIMGEYKIVLKENNYEATVIVQIGGKNLEQIKIKSVQMEPLDENSKNVGEIIVNAVERWAERKKLEVTRS